MSAYACAVCTTMNLCAWFVHRDTEIKKSNKKIMGVKV